jgi:hypothetical protein
VTAPNGASTPERTEYRRSFPVPNNFDLLRLLAAASRGVV